MKAYAWHKYTNLQVQTGQNIKDHSLPGEINNITASNVKNNLKHKYVRLIKVGKQTKPKHINIHMFIWTRMCNVKMIYNFSLTHNAELARNGQSIFQMINHV